ncbi:hypothetical protein, partial [Clostridium perfringens]|uniref:hypothetical protein n=1 Tax=Clostridium perfringens TaxID=1502 RepID=UPI0032217B24
RRLKNKNEKRNARRETLNKGEDLAPKTNIAQVQNISFYGRGTVGRLCRLSPLSLRNGGGHEARFAAC